MSCSVVVFKVLLSNSKWTDNNRTRAEFRVRGQRDVSGGGRFPLLTPSLPPAVFSGVVTAVVFISVCALAAISRLLYQQRRAQRTGGIKEENSQSMYTDYRTELHLHNSVRDNMKEYYI